MYDTDIHEKVCIVSTEQLIMVKYRLMVVFLQLYSRPANRDVRQLLLKNTFNTIYSTI